VCDSAPIKVWPLFAGKHWMEALVGRRFINLFVRCLSHVNKNLMRNMWAESVIG